MSDLTGVVGIAAGVFTSVSMVPQVIKICKEKKADDVSLPMLLILITGLGCWVWYGILKTDWPIIITNGFSVAMNILVVVLKGVYHKRK